MIRLGVVGANGKMGSEVINLAINDKDFELVCAIDKFGAGKRLNENVIVIYDDISLDVGRIRVRRKGSDGGHNGIKSIIQHLGHDVFPRIKMGVGEKPKGYDLADYVLGHFKKEERVIMDESVVTATKAIELMVIDEIGEAMNLYNKKAKQVE